MARARLGFSAINNRIELTDLNHGTTAARWHQFANRRQFNAKLGGWSFDLIFCFRHDRQQQTARSLRIAQPVSYTHLDVYKRQRLHHIMLDIHHACVEHGGEGDQTNYVQGANIAGFVKVADAMLSQGVF